MAVKIIADNEKKLSAYLKGLPSAKEEQHLFSQLINAQDEILRFSEINQFIEGFQLGARFITDTLVLPKKALCEISANTNTPVAKFGRSIFFTNQQASNANV